MSMELREAYLEPRSAYGRVFSGCPQSAPLVKEPAFGAHSWDGAVSSVYNPGMDDLHCPFLPFLHPFAFALMHNNLPTMKELETAWLMRVQGTESGVQKRWNQFLPPFGDFQTWIRYKLGRWEEEALYDMRIKLNLDQTGQSTLIEGKFETWEWLKMSFGRSVQDFIQGKRKLNCQTYLKGSGERE